MGDPPLAPPLDEIVAASGIPASNGNPYTHISATLVAWNEQVRIGRLLPYLRPYFEEIVVGVQESDDDTLRIAREFADTVVVDKHHGFGDATYGPRVLPFVSKPWSFKVDCDEWPNEELLGSLSNATWYAREHDLDGIWIPFRSAVDGIEYEEQHGHLRLFQTHVGWPATLHSRPMIENTAYWRAGFIRHDRSLDELVRDYLRYLRIGQGNAGWDFHNRLMIRSACMGTAQQKGWAYVQSFDWWPEVAAKAYDEGDTPWQSQ
jgi:hypothetical protein